MHWYVNSGAMTMAVTNAVDVVSSAINASLLTNDTQVCDHVFFSALPPDCEMSIINVCQEMWKVLLCPCIRNKFVISPDSRPLSLFRGWLLSSLFYPLSEKSSRRRVVFYFFPEFDVVGGSWKPNVENQLFWLCGSPSKMCPPDFQIELFLKHIWSKLCTSWKWEKQ